MARQPLVVQGCVIIEASWSYSDTPQSVGLLWTIEPCPSQRALPDNTQRSQETDIHASGGIRTRSLKKASGRRPTS